MFHIHIKRNRRNPQTPQIRENTVITRMLWNHQWHTVKYQLRSCLHRTARQFECCLYEAVWCLTLNYAILPIVVKHTVPQMLANRSKCLMILSISNWMVSEISDLRNETFTWQRDVRGHVINIARNDSLTPICIARPLTNVFVLGRTILYTDTDWLQHIKRENIGANSSLHFPFQRRVLPYESNTYASKSHHTEMANALKRFCTCHVSKMAAIRLVLHQRGICFHVVCQPTIVLDVTDQAWLMCPCIFQQIKFDVVAICVVDLYTVLQVHIITRKIKHAFSTVTILDIFICHCASGDTLLLWQFIIVFILRNIRNAKK